MGFFKIPQTFMSLEVRGEEDNENTFHRWANKDCVPVPKAQRVYTTWAFTGYWRVPQISWQLRSNHFAGLPLASMPQLGHLVQVTSPMASLLDKPLEACSQDQSSQASSPFCAVSQALVFILLPDLTV